ncbi:transcriptional regulator, GntR family [Longilinea arvoryzae]|uniref:Transcriptional regulator, GntR family n=1 Tax=Longilinea arvoryzae TaxID=360412 RepID=A0A0S7B7G9_9CHLR|nr:GntR family transcriptional regulator [Longilinea arvoryzae]GAP13143.1 transcriptional regulator, GntR family [Longilinea arvoryzae]
MPKPEKIDFNNHVPYYIQLIEILKGMVDEKIWKPGDQIPGEEELCQTYQISRTVVRQALQELEREGVIVRRKGKGTFIAEPKIVEGLVEKLTGFYSDMVERGLKPQTKVIHHRVIPADEKVAGFLEIPVGTPVVDIRRLRSIDNVPIQLVSTYIPLSLCPKLAEVDLTNRSLYEFLEKECGLFISRGRRFIEAVTASNEEAHFLQIAKGDPLIKLDSISFLENGTPVEYYHAFHRGDRSRFVVELFRSRETSGKIDDLVDHPENLPGSSVNILPDHD